MIFRIYNFFISVIRGVVAPPFCLHCNKALQERVIFCRHCFLKVSPVAPYYLKVKHHNFIVYAVAAYKDPLKKLILSKHYGNVAYLDMLFEFVVQSSFVEKLDFDCIVPVPLHWTRYAKRGFNQSSMLAEKIHKKTKKPIYHAVTRTLMTKYQFNLSSVDRAKNVENAFFISDEWGEKLAGKKILLVDDLFTTGATTRSVIRSMLQMNLQNIKVFVACRALN